jgi:hypothetical protein
MVEIVVIIVNLRRGQLTLVYNIFGGKGTNIETLCEGYAMCCTFSKDIELTFKVCCIEGSAE